MDKVNVAVIGYGHLGKWHAQKANELQDANLVAIVEPYEANKKAASEAYPNTKVVDSIDEVMNEIDAAVIVTPTSTHFALTKHLLQNNKHVFCEKPLCSTYEEAVALKEFLGDRVLQVGHSERCHQAWEELHDEFKNLKGRKTIKIDRYAAFKGRATDVDVVQDLMIHDIDLMLYLFGSKPKEVYAHGHKIRTDKWDHATAHFSFENGDEVIITSGRNHVREVRALEVMSAQGCHFVDLFANTIAFATNTQFEDGTFVKESSYPKRDHLLMEQENFYQSILKGTDPMVGYQDGVNAILYLNKVIEALDTGKRISL